MPTRAVLGLIATAITVGVEPAAGQDWPQWRGPDRDGHSPDRELRLDWERRPPELLWRAQGLGRGYASVSIVGDLIFTTGNRPDGQYALALSRRDGQPVWQRRLTQKPPQHGFSGSRCTPAVAGDSVFVVSSDGRIVCLQRQTGALVWERSFSDWGGRMMSTWGFSESPLVDGDFVLCTPGGPNACLVALRRESGTEVWASPSPPSAGRGVDGAGYSSVVVTEAAGVRQYIALTGRGLIGVRAADGRLLWSYNKVANSTANIPTPVCFGDFVFSSTGYQTGAALLKLVPEAGGVAAQEQYFLEPRVFQNHHGGMVLVDGHIYAGHGHNKGLPICVDVLTGEVRWGGRLRGVGEGSACVIAAGQQLIFRYETGELALITASPEGYDLQGTFRPDYQKGKSWAHPVLCGGKLYLREQDQLMCFRP